MHARVDSFSEEKNCQHVGSLNISVYAFGKHKHDDTKRFEVLGEQNDPVVNVAKW